MKYPKPTAEDWIILRLAKDLARFRHLDKDTLHRSFIYLTQKLGDDQVRAMLIQIIGGH